MLRRSHLMTFCLAAATLVAILCVVGVSLAPGSYYVSDQADPATWVYRPGNVALVCAVMLAEAALVWCALVSPWPRARGWRCILAMIFLVPWALLVTLVVIRMPMYVVVHHLWLWGLVTLLALVALASIARGMYAKLRRARLPP